MLDYLKDIAFKIGFGYDETGYDINGYDEAAFNKEKIHKKTKTEFDPKGYDINGYDINGFNKERIHKKTKTKFDPSDYDIDGYNKLGYDKDGYNKLGYDKDGYDKFNFNKKNIHKITGTLFDEDGYDKSGYNNNGWNKDKIHKDTDIIYDSTGFDINGLDKQKFNKSGFNNFSIHKDTNTIYDLNGYNKNGYDFVGYNKGGFNRNGEIKIPQFYTNEINIEEYSNDQCPICGTKHKNSTSCKKCNWEFIYTLEEQTKEQISEYNKKVKQLREDYNTKNNIYSKQLSVVWSNDIKNLQRSILKGSIQEKIYEDIEEKLINALNVYEETYTPSVLKVQGEFEKTLDYENRKRIFINTREQYEQNFEKARKLYILNTKKELFVNLFNNILGSPRLRDLKYHADDEYFDAILYANKITFENKIKIYIPIVPAKKFKIDYHKAKLKYIFMLEKNTVVGNSIDIILGDKNMQIKMLNKVRFELQKKDSFMSFIEYIDYPSAKNFIQRMRYLIDYYYKVSYKSLIGKKESLAKISIYVDKYSKIQQNKNMKRELNLLKDYLNDIGTGIKELKKFEQAISSISCNKNTKIYISIKNLENTTIKDLNITIKHQKKILYEQRKRDEQRKRNEQRKREEQRNREEHQR